MTSRAIYANPRIWRLLMWRVVGDFIPAINKIYIQVNRYLAVRSVLPDIGPALRARSALRPDDDNQLVPLFNRLINEVAYSQAWRTLDRAAALKAGYGLAALDANPYDGATVEAQRPAAAPGDFPRLNAMLVTGTLSTVLETLDHWQREDPLDEYLRTHAPAAIDPATTPVNRIPWIHAAIASGIQDESARRAIDVVGFLFDYIFKDPSLPSRSRVILGGLQIPILKVALAEPRFFVDEKHPARRLVEGLAAQRPVPLTVIRDKLAGVDIPFDVRGFIGTVWAEYMTLLRQARGIESDDYVDAVETLDDMLWSIAIKERKGKKARLSKIIPSLVQRLRSGGTAARASGEQMKRFLSALYDLHIAAIRPGAGTPDPGPRPAAPSFNMCKEIGNLHDFVADLVIGTWLAFDQKGIPVHLRLSWVSPWRSTYIFASPSGSTVMALTPEELA